MSKKKVVPASCKENQNANSLNVHNLVKTMISMSFVKRTEREIEEKDDIEEKEEREER